MEVNLRGESRRRKISASLVVWCTFQCCIHTKHVTERAEPEGAPKTWFSLSSTIINYLCGIIVVNFDVNFCFHTRSAVTEIYFRRTDLKKTQKIIFMRQKMESGALKPVQRLKVREALSFAVACENVSQCILFFSHRYRNNYARIKNGPVERFCLMDGETGLLLSARYRSSQGICWSNSFDGKTVLLLANHCRRV